MGAGAGPSGGRAELTVLACFVVALGAGCFSIHQVPSAWPVPAALVLVYSLFLWTTQLEGGRQVRDTIRDSPYYLGFLLTQIALVALFIRFRPGAGSLVDLSHGLGIALSTSIVGLASRQVFVLASPPPPAERPLQQEDPIRQALVEHQRTQREFAAFVDSFVAQREQLMDAERASSREYVKAMKTTLASLQRVQERVGDNIEKAARQSSELLDRSHRSMTESIVGATDALATRTESLRSRLSALEGDITRISSGLRGASPVPDLESLRSASAETAAAMRTLGESGAVIGRTARETSDLAGAILDDLKAVDAILTEFVAIASQRIKDLDRGEGRT